MGQANGKELEFSTSFDCSYSPPSMHTAKSISSRVDSTTSEDGGENPPEEKPTKEFGSSASLQIFNNKKKFASKENKVGIMSLHALLSILGPTAL